jgi:membrane-associated phospholipid phosphatase
LTLAGAFIAIVFAALTATPANAMDSPAVELPATAPALTAGDRSPPAPAAVEDAAPAEEARAAGSLAPPTTAGSPAATTAAIAPAKPRLNWNPAWPRFRSWEYAGTILVGGASLYLHFHRVLPAQPRWQGDNPFDDTVRGWLRAGSRADRLRAADFSDVLQFYAPIVSYLADIPVILAVDHDARLSWQILMMDLEANSVAGFITNTLFMTAGRARPSYANCAADPSYDVVCAGRGTNASFPSGHALTVGTAVGLMCVHHRYLPISGHPLADGGACAFMILATVTTAVTRVAADRHWASDALFGAAVGFGCGYGLPWFLHYRDRTDGYGRDATRDRGAGDRRADRASARDRDASLAVVPFGGQRAVGLAIVGVI